MKKNVQMFNLHCKYYPDHKKSTKHILFYWIVFSFLFNPPFRKLFQPIS